MSSRPSLRSEVRTTAALAAPLVLGHLSTGLVAFVDSVIAGHHGTRTLAAVTIGSALYWLPLTVVLGTLMSVPPAVSQLAGAGKKHEIGPLFRQALWLAAGLGPLMFVVLSLLPLALGPIGISPDIAPGATAFLQGLRWGVPAFTLFLCMRYLSDGLHFTLPSMLLSFGGLLLLAPLGYALTFGAFGAPELGARGLGLAAATVMWWQALALGAYLWRAPRFAELGLFAVFEPPRWSALRGLLAVGAPIGFIVLMEGSLFIAASLLIGRLGEVPAASHQVAINVASLCFMVPLGLAEATTVRVGFAVGAGSSVRRAAIAGYLLLLATQSFTALLLVFGRHRLVTLYSDDVRVTALAAGLMLFAAAFQFPDGAQVVANGALRGLKDTRVPMLLAAVAYWGLGIPLGAWLALGLGLGPPGMWTGMIAGLLLAAILLSARFVRASAHFLASAASTSRSTADESPVV